MELGVNGLIAPVEGEHQASMMRKSYLEICGVNLRGTERNGVVSSFFLPFHLVSYSFKHVLTPEKS